MLRSSAAIEYTPEWRGVPRSARVAVLRASSSWTLAQEATGAHDSERIWTQRGAHGSRCRTRYSASVALIIAYDHLIGERTISGSGTKETGNFVGWRAANFVVWGAANSAAFWLCTAIATEPRGQDLQYDSQTDTSGRLPRRRKA